jgi:hypothetical protein
MSFNSDPLEIFPSSNHSLYTPSYSASALAPIKCPELDLEPSLPVSRKVPEKSVSSSLVEAVSLKSRHNPKSRDPVQYQKLKMNYLRRLNVIPIISHKDVMAVIGSKEASPKDFSSGVPMKKKRSPKGGKQSPESESCAMKRFVPSFLPSQGLASKPIPIPQRAKKISSAPSLDDLEKGDIAQSCVSSTPQFKPASLIPEHYGVFFGDFEL